MYLINGLCVGIKLVSDREQNMVYTKSQQLYCFKKDIHVNMLKTVILGT